MDVQKRPLKSCDSTAEPQVRDHRVGRAVADPVGHPRSARPSPAEAKLKDTMSRTNRSRRSRPDKAPGPTHLSPILDRHPFDQRGPAANRFSKKKVIDGVSAVIGYPPIKDAYLGPKVV